MGGDLDAERQAIAAQLPAVIKRLQRRAGRTGTVSQAAFAAEAARLGLETDEQKAGLRRGLAGVGIRLKASRATRELGRSPAAASSPGAQGFARSRAVFAPLGAQAVGNSTVDVPSPAAKRLVMARQMLARYAEPDGSVSRLARDGVARLTGLSSAEAQELTTGFPVTRPLPPQVAAPVRPRTGKRRDRAAVPAEEHQHADAVRAARVVLEEDRWRRAPEKTLLKAVEEVGLAVLLRGGTGDLGRDIPEEEITKLPREEEQWRAFECLVRHNRRLVWGIARHYEGRGLDREDLEQHGTLGLMRAARKFDATKGYKFSTYATWWIKQSISRGIADEGTTIRIPVHFHERVHKVASAERKLLSEGRPRTVDNVAYATGLTFAEVEEVRKLSRPTDSLDRIIGDDTALGELIAGPCRLPSPCAAALRKEFYVELGALLETFAERERYIIVWRTGMDGGERRTLDEIGVAFGVTRERIRQIESKVMPLVREELMRRGLAPRRR
ncbi:sigma-70 family RNA polymerase sigma factor [Streptomyces sp. NPDC055140]